VTVPVGEKDHVDSDSDVDVDRDHDILALSCAEVQERLADGRDRDAVMVPLGTTDEHGAHIPLGTDRRVVQDLFDNLPERGLEVRRFAVEITGSDHLSRA
jgi:creatinine amidohydrolase